MGLILFSQVLFAAQNNDTILWYARPANPKVWEEALPIGSGRLGAMVFGGTENERIQFNEDTLWTGKPHDYTRDRAGEVLELIRQLLFEGKTADAVTLTRQRFLSDPVRQKAFQPFGDLRLNFPGHDAAVDYRRQLDLETGIAGVSYQVGQTTFRREVFASYPDNVIVVRLTADQPGQINFTVKMDSPHKTAQTNVAGTDTLVMTGRVSDLVPPHDLGMSFESRLRVIPSGGTIGTTADGLGVRNADSVTLVLVAATSFKNFQDITANPDERCRSMLANVAGKSYETLRTDHVTDHSAMFDRVKIDLGPSTTDLPTNERLARIVMGAGGNAGGKDAAAPNNLSASGLDTDPGLAALFFQYGRYMLISSSRPGTQAATLQGVWNELLNPPWESKYTTNINVEMNYWPAETTNLSECTGPLFDMIDDLMTSGGIVASEQYHARGWVVHHNTDIWRGAAPINNIDGVWPTGGAWLCQHLWEHYLFTGDKDFLAKQAYPAMKGASLFFLDSLVKDPKTAYLVTCPSYSPEEGDLCAGPAMDMQLIRALFDHTIAATSILKIDGDLAKQLVTARAKLAPDKIGKYGQLQEWQDDVDVPNNNHRHMSPLWGLYPGNEFTPDTLKIFDAAKLLLKWRGDGSTGWSYAWRIPLWARVYDGEFAYRQLYLQLAKRTFSNLFDKCGPFQVDGNFGATAGIAEMLMQSQLNRIDLLPALPAQWANGSVSGLCARGGFEVDMTWSGGLLTRATIHSKLGQPCKIRYGTQEIELTTIAGKSYEFDGGLKAITASNHT